MKKFFTVVMICMIAALATVLCACADGGTYPSSGQMRSNLEAKGYEVTVEQNPDGKSGTHLSATKDDEFIEFYWLDSADDCDYFYGKLENMSGYYIIGQVTDSSTHGNLVYCATENAFSDAGIK